MAVKIPKPRAAAAGENIVISNVPARSCIRGEFINPAPRFTRIPLRKINARLVDGSYYLVAYINGTHVQMFPFMRDPKKGLFVRVPLRRGVTVNNRKFLDILI